MEEVQSDKVEEVQSDKVTKSDNINESEAMEVVSENMKHAGSVYNAKIKDFVRINPEIRDYGLELQQRLNASVLVNALILFTIEEHEIYLHMGFSSMAEYVNSATIYEESTMRKYRKIGRKYAPLLPANLSDLMKRDSNHALNEKINEIGSLGFSKIYELTKLEDDEFEEVINNDTITLSNGTTLSLNEVKGMKSRELTDQIQQHRKYINDLEAELDKTASERDKALADAEQANKDSETGKKYKDLYGPRSKEYESFKSRIAVARNRALDLNQSTSQIKDLPAEEFEALRDELRDLHKLIDRGLAALREDNMESFMNVSQD